MNSTALVGFFDELNKISADLRTEIARKTDLDPVEAAKTVGSGAIIGGSVLGNVLLNKNLAETEIGSHTTPEDIARLRRAIGGEGQLVQGGLRSAVHIPKQGRLTRDTSLIPSETGPHIGAHELGHGRLGRSSIGKILRAGKLYHYAPAAGALAGSAMSSLDPDSTASKLAPLVGAAGAAPMLADEAAASIHAIRGMQKAKYTAAQIAKGKKQLLKAFGTYALGVGVPSVMAPVAMRHLMKSVSPLVPQVSGDNA